MNLPSLFHSADTTAALNQQRFLRIRKIELVLLVVAAVASVTHVAPAPVIVIMALGAAFVLGTSKSGAVSEKRWYEARAAAESLKSMAWQYAVGGEAFRIDDTTASERFLEECRRYLNEPQWLDTAVDPESPDTITADMMQIRSAQLERRLDVYAEERVQDQLGWYSRNSETNRSRAKWWNRGLLGVELVGVAAALAVLLGNMELNWISALAGVAVAITAWQRTRRYSELSVTYAIASHDISQVQQMLRAVSSEPEWAQAVHDAEAAFSREHTLWRARRHGPLTATGT